MDDPDVPQNVKDNIEFVLDVSNNNSHILHVDLKKNYTRSEEAKQLRSKILEEEKSKRKQGENRQRCACVLHRQLFKSQLS